MAYQYGTNQAQFKTGTYKDEKQAQNMMNMLNQSYGGQNTRIANENGAYRVYSDFADQNRANAVNQRLQQLGKVGTGYVSPSSSAQQVQTRQDQNFAPVDTNQYRTQSATIDDISKKYGFDFSRDYAKRQAEAEAQAKRNANADAQRRNSSNKAINLKAIDNNLMSQAEGLDRNYFQQYQQQQQAQVNGGINGGIAADQDLRMAMARQAAMGDSYRDANLGRMQENQRFTNDDLRLAEELGLINQSALAREDSLYNDRLMQGAGLAQNLDQFNLSQNGMLLDAALNQRGQNIGIEQYLQDMDRMRSRDQRSDMESDRQFDWTKAIDQRDYNRGVLESDRGYNRGVLESDRGYNRGVLESDRDYGFNREQFDWSKNIDTQQLAISRQNAANSVLKAQQVALDKASKPKTKAQTSLDAMSYWADQQDLINKDGAYRIEKGLRSDPQAMKELINQGYDPDTVIDALWNISTKGQFPTRSAYDKYVEALKKQTAKEDLLR